MLIAVHCCHPSLANDNLSGIAVAIELATAARDAPAPAVRLPVPVQPGTIGSIAWLHFNRDAPQRIRHGLVLSCLGDAGHRPTSNRAEVMPPSTVTRPMRCTLRAMPDGCCPSFRTAMTSGNIVRRDSIFRWAV